jgi:hypothetical protein
MAVGDHMSCLNAVRNLPADILMAAQRHGRQPLESQNQEIYPARSHPPINGLEVSISVGRVLSNLHKRDLVLEFLVSALQLASFQPRRLLSFGEIVGV